MKIQHAVGIFCDDVHYIITEALDMANINAQAEALVAALNAVVSVFNL